jgi:hypothetical protein
LLPRSRQQRDWARQGTLFAEHRFRKVKAMSSDDDDDRGTQDPRAPQKDPDEWVTGDEPMTRAQASYLQTLATEAGEDFDPGLSKAEASKRIDELQRITGRGQSKVSGSDGGDSIRKNETSEQPPLTDTTG